MYRFGEFSMRAVTPETDGGNLRAAVAADPEHRDSVRPEFFLKPEAGAEVFALEDAKGTLMYVKVRRAIRLDIQFVEVQSRADRERMMDALKAGFEFVAARARGNGFLQILFASKFTPLKRFCVKRLGFRGSADEMICALAPMEKG